MGQIEKICCEWQTAGLSTSSQMCRTELPVLLQVFFSSPDGSIPNPAMKMNTSFVSQQISYLQAYTCASICIPRLSAKLVGKTKEYKRQPLPAPWMIPSARADKSQQNKKGKRGEEEKKNAQLNHRRWNRPLVWLRPEWGCIHLIKGGLNYPGKNNRTEWDGLGSSNWEEQDEQGLVQCRWKGTCTPSYHHIRKEQKT